MDAESVLDFRSLIAHPSCAIQWELILLTYEGEQGVKKEN